MAAGQIRNGLPTNTRRAAGSPNRRNFTGDQPRSLGHPGAAGDRPFQRSKSRELGAGPYHLSDQTRGWMMGGIVLVASPLHVQSVTVSLTNVLTLRRASQRAYASVQIVAGAERQSVFSAPRARHDLVLAVVDKSLSLLSGPRQISVPLVDPLFSFIYGR